MTKVLYIANKNSGKLYCIWSKREYLWTTESLCTDFSQSVQTVLVDVSWNWIMKKPIKLQTLSSLGFVDIQ